MRVEQIGDATLYLGDCREAAPSFPTPDAVITDPPYEIINDFGVALTGKSKGRRVMSFSFDVPGVVRDVVLPTLEGLVARASGVCGHFVFAAADHISHFHAMFRRLGYVSKPAVWVKPYPPPPMKGNWWVSAHELALYAYKRGAYFGDDSAKRPNVFSFDTYRHGMPGKVAHPTQKPERLLAKIVSAMVPPGATVVDPFMGSGTTAVVCAKACARFVGAEVNPAYFDIACRRVEAAYKQRQLNLSGVA